MVERLTEIGAYDMFICAINTVIKYLGEMPLAAVQIRDKWGEMENDEKEQDGNEQ